MRKRAGPPFDKEPSRTVSLPKRQAGEMAANAFSEGLFDFVQPIEVRFEDAAGERLVDRERGGAVRQARLELARGVQTRGELGDFGAERAEPGEHRLAVGELGAEQTYHGLVLDPRERRRGGEPLAQRLPCLV